MATSTNQAWVSVEVKQGSTKVVTPTIVTATDEDTFGSLLEKVGSADLQLQCQTVEKVTIAGKGPTVHIVPLDAPVIVVSLTHETLYLLKAHDINSSTCIKGHCSLHAWLLCTSILKLQHS